MAFYIQGNYKHSSSACRRNSFRRCSLAAVALLFVCAGLVQAEVTEQSKGSGFRRVFVPANRPDVWPTNGEQYLPVDKAQLQELLQRAGGRDGISGGTTASATDAVFYARYIVNRLIDGRACIEITSPSGQRSLIAWPTARTHIRDPQWRTREDEVVKLGTWGRDEAKVPHAGLLVERPGSLLFKFETPATVQSEQWAQFAVASPHALRRRFYIDLPGDHELISDEGRVELVQSPAQDMEESSGASLKLDQLGLGYRRWLLSLGPGDTMDVRVKLPSTPDRVPSNSLSYREDLTYSLTPRGVDFTAEFQFLGNRELPEAITIELDSELHLVGAEWGQLPLSWRELSRGAAEPAQVLLEIPREARDRPSSLRLSAWSRFPGRELRRLPEVSLPDSFWNEGTVRLELAEGLELLDLQTSELLPNGASSSNASMHRTWEFIKLRSQAVPEVAVRQSAAGVEAAIGTSLELSGAGTKAVTRLQLRPRGKSIPPRLEVEVLGSWEIDAVETSDASDFTDWYVDQIDGRRILCVQLRDPIDSTYPIEVAIEAHAPRSAAVESLPLAELMPIDWRPLDPSRHVLAVTVLESLDLQIDGQVRRLSFDDLVEQDWELLQDADVDVMVLMNEADLSAGLRLLPQKPTLEAEVQLVVDVQRGNVNYEATIWLAPLRIPASKVRVQLMPATKSDVAWIDSETEAQLPAVRVSDPKQAVELGEVWEVQLANGSAKSQTFHAKWTSELVEGFDLPLVVLPEAAKQRATISVVGDRPESLLLVPTGLIQHPLTSLSRQIGRNPIATYRYDPVQILRDKTACRLAIQPRESAAAVPRAVIESVHLESKYPSGRYSIHRAEFVLESVADLRCQLPAGAQLHRVTWNGEALNVDAKLGTFRIDPPAGTTASSHTLHIDFAIPQPPLRDGMLLAPALPDLGLPLSEGKWTLQVPDSIHLATPEFLRGIEPGWRGRLAGNWVGESSHIPADLWRRATAPLGWNTWRLDFAGALPTPVRLLEMDKRQSLAYGVGFLVACLTAWQLVGRPQLLTVLLIVTALASLWLPPTHSMFATASWLGLLFGVGGNAIAGLLLPKRIARREHATTLSIPYATACLAVALTLVVPHPLSAQNDNADLKEEIPRQNGDAVQVLIPVDEQGKAAGIRHYVPARFWEELLQKTRENGHGRSGDWVILRGRYLGELRRDTTGGEVHPSLWTLSWEVESLKRHARLWLPLDRRDGKWEQNASVDGIPAAIAWDESGMGCEVVIREPGPHRIAIRVEPFIHDNGQHAEILLKLPALLDAELKLIYPSDLQDLVFPDATIPTPLDSRRSRAVVALPMGDRLALGWQLPGQSASAAPAWQVDQLELLSITPSGAELELRLLLEGSGAPPAEVTIRVDEELESLDTIATTDASREGRRVSIPVTVEETAGDSSRGSVTARFRVRREHVLGNYRYPQVTIERLSTRSKTAAVSLAEQFSYETMQSPVGESIEGSSFASLWGDTPPTYAAAHRVQGDQAPWTFSVQPHVASSTPKESLVVVCAPTELELTFQSQVEAKGFPVVRQTLQVPPEMKVEEMKLERSIGREPVRWTRPAPDRVVAFFAAPLEEYFRLSLVGTIPLRPGQEVPIPVVTSRPGENLSQRIQIDRRPECLVEISGLEPDTIESESRSPGLHGGDIYAVTAFTERTENLAQVTIRTSQNESRYASQSLTLFDPEVGVIFESQLKVTRGVLDHVILEAPAEWIGPLEISPSAQVGELGEKTTGRRQVKIQFARPVPAGERFHLRFSGSVAAARDGSWLAPLLVLADSQTDVSYVAIPGESPATGQWTMEGIIEINTPPTFVRETDLPSGTRFYRVRPARRRDYSVRRLPDSDESALASLALADVFVREDSRGSRVQTALFSLPPIGERELILEWPAECDPVGVYLENRLLAPIPIDAKRWRLPIGPTDLPVVLTAVSRSGNGNSAATREFRRPELWQGETLLEIPLTLWTIESPRSAPIPIPAAGTAGSAAEHSTLRLARLSQLLSMAEPRMSELFDEDRRAWKQLWMARLQAESSRLEGAAIPSAISSGQVDGEVNTFRERGELIAQVANLLGRMSELEVAEVAADAGPKELRKFEEIHPVGRSDRRVDYYSVSAPQAGLELAAGRPETMDSLPRLAMTFLLVATLGALLRWAPEFNVTRTVASYPRWVVVALGALWWAFLPSAAIGMALIAVAALTWAADRWQNGGLSTVARSS